MVYANVVLAAGLEEYAERAAAAAGASGLIVPDLPHDESGGAARGLRRRRASRWCRWWRPPRTPERLAAIGADARGFVYTVSLTGTTGERSRAAPGARRHRWSASGRATSVPVAVGFGISTAEQARAVGRRWPTA